MIVDQQFEAVVRAGLFRDRQHALQEAMQTLFVARPQLRTEAAIELFRSGEISLLRAAEMVGMDFESFRVLLRDRGISWEVEAESSAAMDQAIQDFLGARAEWRRRGFPFKRHEVPWVCDDQRQGGSGPKLPSTSHGNES
jgi:predicted HTH domain antitoxin